MVKITKVKKDKPKADVKGKTKAKLEVNVDVDAEESETDIEEQNVEVGEAFPGTVSQILIDAREGKKLTVEDVASSLNIRVSQVKAIEQNNLEGLPGMTYAAGFVRSYANLLGLDGTSISKQFKEEHLAEKEVEDLYFPEPVDEKRIPSPIMLGVGAFLAIVFLIGWTVYSNMDLDLDFDRVENANVVPSVEEFAEKFEAAPSSSELTAVPDAQVAPVVDEVSLAPAVKAEGVETSEASEAVVANNEAPKLIEQEVAEVVAVKPKEPEEIKVKTTNSNEVMLLAKQASWIQITDKKQKVIFRKVLRPGDKYFVPNKSALSLVTANAGGLEIYVGGKKIQPIGKSGEIVRGISLNPHNLKKIKYRASSSGNNR